VKAKRSKKYMLFRKSVRWAVVSVMTYSGAVFLWNLLHQGPTARILVYHKISNNPLDPFSVSPRDFEAQVRFLSQAYRVISLEELIAHIRAGDIPSNAVAITLDDGFKDNYTHAYPILKRYRVPATLFVIVDHLGPHTPSAGQGALGASGPHLSWDQVVEMSENGFSFGSHTLTHPWLTQVPLEQARREIVDSKARLEQRLGKPVRLFAYPGGRVCDFNPDIKAIVAESGYSGACIGLNGTNRCNTDPYLLRRTKIEANDGMYVFRKAMKGGLDIFILLDLARRFLSS
jgi:peptidoglycan/xylan/chitin deacetylase (PgdA/CDA1 family)